MINCPICGKEFDEKTGRRPKRFCSEPCKIKFWNANKKTPKKESVPEFKQSLDKTPKEVIEEVDKKIEEMSKTPTTLLELKALCPPELTGFERSEWVSKNRVKYNL